MGRVLLLSSAWLCLEPAGCSAWRAEEMGAGWAVAEEWNSEGRTGSHISLGVSREWYRTPFLSGPQFLTL